MRVWLTPAADLVLACAAGWAAATLIARYWAFFYIGTSGANGVALVSVYLPVLVATAWGITAIINHLMRTCAVAGLSVGVKLLALV